MERKGVWMCIFLVLAIALAVYIVSRPSKENYDHNPDNDPDASLNPSAKDRNFVLIPTETEEENHDGIEIIHNDEV